MASKSSAKTIITLGFCWANVEMLTRYRQMIIKGIRIEMKV